MSNDIERLREVLEYIHVIHSSVDEDEIETLVEWIYSFNDDPCNDVIWEDDIGAYNSFMHAVEKIAVDDEADGFSADTELKYYTESKKAPMIDEMLSVLIPIAMMYYKEHKNDYKTKEINNG